jgi:hypothetical protein
MLYTENKTETETEDMFCVSCGEEMDKTCSGDISCPECDGPCLSCTDGGGGAQAVLDALSGRTEAEEAMWSSLPLQYSGEEYWRDDIKALLSWLEWDRAAETEEELFEWIGEWASNSVPVSTHKQWEMFAELKLWTDRDAMENASVSISEPGALAEMAIWWSHYSLGSHVAEHLSRYLVKP